MSTVDPPRPVDVLFDDECVPGWLIGWDGERHLGTVRYTRYVALASLTGPVSYSEAAGSSWFTWEQSRSMEQIRARADEPRFDGKAA